MAIINRIKYDGNADGSSWLVHKYPSESFVLGSQLIVNQGQEALFLKGGAALDLFSAGTHTLATGNLPLLNKLVNLPFGGKTPFAAEVYYVNKTARLDLGWGTSNPIDFEDPKYHIFLNVRINGQFGITINDTRLFISRIIGAVPNGSVSNYLVILKYFNGVINTKVKSIVAKFMLEKNISFLEISAHLDDLSGVCQSAISEEFERFGVEIVNFFVETIKPREEDLEAMKKKREEVSAMKLELGELGRDFYAQRRSFDVMEEMAGTPGSGELANAGIGLGIGLGAAGQMGGAFAGIAQNINLNPQPPASGGALKCTKCGAGNPPGQKFCGTCGEKIELGIKCADCGAVVPPGQKFCGECGKPIANIKCPACGVENAPTQKFCGGCGNKLGG
ncbi:MAG: SPFH domain-containing protein [Oscillospiraceae bacterium]|jgi:membrane protease subunit (stomatin/prohibitin family)|nr:SPFH domain-containing protein [Oscillospiraceae bacterium]